MRELGPSYQISSWLFLRGLGLVFFIAFVSLWVQGDGLFYANGISPIHERLTAYDTYIEGQDVEVNRVLRFPTLFWLHSTNAAIQAALAIGTLSSLGILTGVVTPLCCFICWIIYLSFLTTVSPFLNFQWDILLLETSLLALFFAPWKWLEHSAKSTRYHPLFRWLILWLAWRLMFESGIVKLNSYGPEGENTWRDLTALNYHYFTQPIPHWISYYVHQLPNWFQQLSLWFMFFIELAVPFFLFGPRFLRHCAVGLLITLQILIMGTGNFGFFNLLTLILFLPALNDSFFPKAWFKALKSNTLPSPEKKAPKVLRWAGASIRYPLAFIIITLSTISFLHTIKRIDMTGQNDELLQLSEPMQALNNTLRPFASINSYGLFRVMTTERPEIMLEGSLDGKEWKPYEFKWKVNDETHMPGIMIPHMPRLDWQMWFAALRYQATGRLNSWFVQFLKHLGSNTPEVTALLKSNPFSEEAPSYFRIQLKLYSYTNFDEKKETGHYWTSETLPAYTNAFPVSRLQQ